MQFSLQKCAVLTNWSHWLNRVENVTVILSILLKEYKRLLLRDKSFQENIVDRNKFDKSGT